MKKDRIGDITTDIISIAGGVVVGGIIKKLTGITGVAVVSGVAVAFLAAEALCNKSFMDKTISDIEEAGGKITFTNYSVLNGVDIRYVNKDGNDCRVVFGR